MTSFDPSVALATVAASLFAIEQGVIATDVLEEWITRTGAELQELPQAWVEAWKLEPAELQRVHDELIPGRVNLDSINYRQFLELVTALQILDRSHFPLTGPGIASGTQKLDWHEAAADNLVYSGFYGKNEEGAVISVPQTTVLQPDVLERNDRLRLAAHPSDPLHSATGETNRPLLLRELMEFTTYLPRILPASDPSDGRTLGGRTVDIRLIHGKSTTVAPGRSLSDPISICIIPAAQAIGDVKFEFSADGTSYGTRPNFPPERLRNLIGNAVREGAELIFLPELVVDEGNIDLIKETIRSSGREYYDENAEVAPFRLLFAGISAKDGASGNHKNYALVLNLLGEELWKQGKLFRWDLSRKQIERFSIDVDCPQCSVPLKEDIDVGETVYLLDDPNFGRFVILICADVDADLPGDWILRSARVDWVYAPIMDQSLGWTFDARGFLGPWICRRAHRAALTLSGRVVVTNSMSLTHRVNLANSRSGDTRQYSDCGIALLLDATDVVPTYTEVRENLATEEDVSSMRQWNVRWDLLP